MEGKLIFWIYLDVNPKSFVKTSNPKTWCNFMDKLVDISHFRHVFERPTISLNPDMPIRIAIRLMSHKGVRHLPVIDKERAVLGIVTVMDILSLLKGPLYHEIVVAKYGGDVKSALFEAAKSIMKEAPTVPVDGDLQSVVRTMAERLIGAAIFIDHEGKLMGIVTERDLAVLLKRPTNIKVSDVMSRDLVYARPSDELNRAVELMFKQKIRRLPILDNDGKLIGLITALDILRCLDLDTFSLMWPISKIMVKTVETVNPQADVAEASSRMKNLAIGSLPVVEAGKLIGIVTERDLTVKVASKYGTDRFISLLQLSG